jgi:hypothetical protein
VPNIWMNLMGMTMGWPASGIGAISLNQVTVPQAWGTTSVVLLDYSHRMHLAVC